MSKPDFDFREAQAEYVRRGGILQRSFVGKEKNHSDGSSSYSLPGSRAERLIKEIANKVEKPINFQLRSMENQASVKIMLPR